MKIIRYWKTIQMPDLPGVTFDLVPLQELNSEQAFFDEIAKAIKASDLDFIFIDRNDKIFDSRGRCHQYEQSTAGKNG